MKNLRITFTACLQQSQAINDTKEHMDAIVSLTVSKRDGSDGKDFQCTVRQPDGGQRAYEKDPIEVQTPDELKNKVNYQEFRDVVERYYRMMVGEDSHYIKTGGDTDIILIGNKISNDANRKIFFIHEADEHSGAW